MRAIPRSHDVGQALHRLRRENGWTLATVSGKTGVAVSTLSKIEKNQTSPNYDVLVRLCEGLEMNLAEFFQAGSGSAFAQASRTVNRLGDGLRYRSPHGEYLVLSAELAKKVMTPRLIRVPKSGETPAVVASHAGEEFVFVLSGAVKFFMEPYRSIVLKTGESVHFDARMPHATVAEGDRDALLLVVSQTDVISTEKEYTGHG